MIKKIKYKDLFTLEGHLNEEGQALFVDALLLDKIKHLPEDLQDHVSECQECRKEIASLYDLVSENRALFPLINHPLLDKRNRGSGWEEEGDSYSRPLMRRLFSTWAIAASVVILIGIAGTIIFLTNHHTTETRSGSMLTGTNKADHPVSTDNNKPMDSIQYIDNQTNKKLLAENGNSKMEAMYHLRLRGVDFKIKSPAKTTSVKFMDKMVFEWEATVKFKKLTLMIMDKSGSGQNQISLKGKKYQFTANLPVGLYYWVIVGDGEAVSAGKFWVTKDQ